MRTQVFDKAFAKGQHPDIQDNHPQILWRCDAGRFRIIFRQFIRPDVKVVAPLVASLQVPSVHPNEEGFWRGKFVTSCRDELMFSCKLEVARRDPHWLGRRVPRRVIQKTTLSRALFSRIATLPSRLELAAGWSLNDLITEADQMSLASVLRSQA